MGQNNSTEVNKRISTSERTKREGVKKEMMNNRLGEIEQFQKNVVNSVSTNALTTQDGIDILLMTEKVKTQVNRGGAALTKADLIAIIVALTKNINVTQYNNLSVNDLNCIIRNIIYDPKKIQRQQQKEDSLVTNDHNYLISYK